jgi:hypothetical protein
MWSSAIKTAEDEVKRVRRPCSSVSDQKSVDVRPRAFDRLERRKQKKWCPETDVRHYGERQFQETRCGSYSSHDRRRPANSSGRNFTTTGNVPHAC